MSRVEAYCGTEIPCLRGMDPDGGVSIVSRGAGPDASYTVRWITCRLSAGPVLCVCRNLRIRTRVTLGRAEVQAPDLRGHWAYKDENRVDPALILRLRQNRPPTTVGAAYNLLSLP